MTKQEKERLTEAERKYWKEESMVKHCVGNTAVLFDLRGKIVPIEKARVRTNFCFGYSDYIEGDYEDANRMANHAGNSEMYFLRENHRRAGYSDIIKDLNDSWYVAYAIPHYCGKSEELYSICFEKKWELETGKKLPENAFILTPEEIQEYKRKLVEAIKLHHKKLAAYLKRYGLSKVNTWTYWQDE